MTSVVERYIVQRFLVLYGEPKTTDLKAYVSEYEKALNGTDAVLLNEGVDIAVKRHTYPTWPTVGECVDAVRSAAERRADAAQRKSSGQNQDIPKQAPSEESRTRVNTMMQQAIASLSKVKTIGQRPVAATRLPDVSRTAWEARFGKGAA